MKLIKTALSYIALPVAILVLARFISQQLVDFFYGQGIGEWGLNKSTLIAPDPILAHQMLYVYLFSHVLLMLSLLASVVWVPKESKSHLFNWKGLLLVEFLLLVYTINTTPPDFPSTILLFLLLQLVLGLSIFLWFLSLRK